MDPKLLMPLLALLFAGLAAGQVWRQRQRQRRLQGAARTWAILAVSFAAVSLWLHRGGG